MNKKETLEIRKQFTNENCAITRICIIMRFIGTPKSLNQGKVL